MTTTQNTTAAEIGWRYLTRLPGEAADVQVWWTPVPDPRQAGNVLIIVRDALFYDAPDGAAPLRCVSLPADAALPVLNRTVAR